MELDCYRGRLTKSLVFSPFADLRDVFNQILDLFAYRFWEAILI